MWVKFDGTKSQIIKASASGTYQTDLALGTWIATTTPNATDKAEESLSRPRHFRVTEAGNVALNLYLRPPMMCDLRIFTPVGRVPTPEELSSRDTFCWGEESFPLPSSDGIAFEVNLGGLQIGNSDPCQTTAPVPLTKSIIRRYATYNLMSLEADQIDYHASTGILEATGSVVIEDEFRKRNAHSMRLYLHDGRIVPVEGNH